MRTFFTLFLAAPLLTGSAYAQAAQTASPTASSMLSPALGQLRQSLSGLRLDKWKAPGPVREETNSNIGSISRDLDSTLPGLLATADSAPGAVSKNLPVFRNVDALYDVLLRIVETADLAAPENETETLHNALATLDDARRSLGDAIESAAVAGEKQDQQNQQLLEQQKKAAAAAPPPAAAVVNDGSKPAATHRHKTTAAKPPAAQPPQ